MWFFQDWIWKWLLLSYQSNVPLNNFAIFIAIYLSYLSIASNDKFCGWNWRPTAEKWCSNNTDFHLEPCDTLVKYFDDMRSCWIQTRRTELVKLRSCRMNELAELRINLTLPNLTWPNQAHSLNSSNKFDQFFCLTSCSSTSLDSTSSRMPKYFIWSKNIFLVPLLFFQHTLGPTFSHYVTFDVQLVNWCQRGKICVHFRWTLPIVAWNLACTCTHGCCNQNYLSISVCFWQNIS